jgi:hypothetical protein
MQMIDNKPLIDLIEYRSGEDGTIRSLANHAYLFAGPHPQEKWLCLAVQRPEERQGMCINIRFLHALTVDGVRHELAVTALREQLRLQEILHIIEGRYSEAWAAQFFDSESEHFHALKSASVPL